jgi:catechol 2,3-dioxygenase-like lactoylglutathione lyase family enzyme
MVDDALTRHVGVSTTLCVVEMPAVSAIALHVSVPVLNTEDAERFYSEAFGARTVSRTPSLVTMQIGAQRIALRQVAVDSVSLQRGARDGLRARHFGFGVATPSEVDEAVPQLIALGAQLVVEPTDRDDGRSAMFCDDSGNQVEVYFEEIRYG